MPAKPAYLLYGKTNDNRRTQSKDVEWSHV